MTEHQAVKQGFLPAYLVAKYVSDYIAKEESKFEECHPVIDILAERCKCSTRLLWELRNGRRQWISFDKAETILLGVCQFNAWFDDDELHSWYTGAVAA